MDVLRGNAWLAMASLFASLATLICCVLPAVLVAIGAGAAVVGLVSAFPGLVWFSERKLLVFGVASAMIVMSGAALWRARHRPCPNDPVLAAACQRVRRVSALLWLTSAMLAAAGAFVAFALPAILG
jgi:hypothetical protein